MKPSTLFTCSDLFLSFIKTDLSIKNVRSFNRSILVYSWFRMKILSGCVENLRGIIMDFCSLGSTNYNGAFQKFANLFCKSTTPFSDFWTETGTSLKISKPNQSTIAIFPARTTNSIPNCRYAHSFISVYPGCLTQHWVTKLNSSKAL